MIGCPKIDERSAEEVVAQLRVLMGHYVPELVLRDTDSGEDEGSRAEALARIFARYCELIIDRLNRAPEKNLLAFLNMAGVSPLPPRSAQVPLTFYLSPQATDSVVVPELTQVAAEMAKGETKPVLFETESELVVVPSRLESLFYKNGELDQYRNWKTAVGPTVPPALDPMSAPMNASPTSSGMPSGASDARTLPHVLFVGLRSRVRWPVKNEVRLRFEFDGDTAASLDERTVQWELCSQAVVQPKVADGMEDRTALIVRTPVTPQTDETKGLTKNGEVIFEDLRQPTPVELAGFSGTWISCRLTTPLTRNSEAKKGAVRSQQIPSIQDLAVEVEYDEEKVPIDFLFSNTVPLDASKEFFPFGERPKFGDTLYLASQGFSDVDARVEIVIELTNPRDGDDSPIARVEPQDVKLGWEFWNGEAWVLLGAGEIGARVDTGRVRFVRDSQKQETDTDFSDATQALTASGTVSFDFSVAPAQSLVNGKTGYWVRARILTGSYGTEASYERNAATGQYTVTPATFAPPSIRSIVVRTVVNAGSRPAAMATFNDFRMERVEAGTAFQPFVATTDDDLTGSVYLGFLPPLVNGAAPAMRALRPFPSRSMSLYAGIGEGPQPVSDSAANDGAVPPATWEYWNGLRWTKWAVRDGTRGFERTGMVRVLAPPDFQSKDEFGVSRYWLRLRTGRSGFDPQILSVLLNTTMALEGMTIRNEVLGASNGRADQRFSTTQSPVLSGQRLEVREPRQLTREEERVVIAEEGPGAFRPASSGAASRHVWVRWHEVANFDGSGPRDRHYVMDRPTGEVRFGDGINGQIPPSLPGNIVMPFYRTGGGERGNKATLTIKQLKTAIPSVTAVTNWMDAGGGGDAETATELIERGPRVLRHGNRAVTAEDYEDLAMAASSQIVRAKCFPLRDVRLKKSEQRKEPGLVSVMVLPRSTDLAPVPGEELLEAVNSFIMDTCSPLVRLVLAGPKYMPVDVEVEVTVDDLDHAGDAELAITLALERYLHPVSGRNGAGWEFGRQPYRSDLWAVMGQIHGVSHVRSLKIGVRLPPEAEGDASQCLVCAGQLTVSVTMQE